MENLSNTKTIRIELEKLIQETLSLEFGVNYGTQVVHRQENVKWFGKRLVKKVKSDVWKFPR